MSCVSVGTSPALSVDFLYAWHGAGLLGGAAPPGPLPFWLRAGPPGGAHPQSPLAASQWTVGIAALCLSTPSEHSTEPHHLHSKHAKHTHR